MINVLVLEIFPFDFLCIAIESHSIFLCALLVMALPTTSSKNEG
jgi:hypothetical protein